MLRPDVVVESAVIVIVALARAVSMMMREQSALVLLMRDIIPESVITLDNGKLEYRMR